MTKPSDKKRRPAKTKTNRHAPGRGNGAIPVLRVRKGASLKEIYAAARRAFTAADLQKYTVDEPMVPAQQLLAELEAIDREEAQKRKGKPRNDRSR